MNIRSGLLIVYIYIVLILHQCKNKSCKNISQEKSRIGWPGPQSIPFHTASATYLYHLPPRGGWAGHGARLPCHHARVSVLFIQVQSPRFKPNTIPNNNFARILQQAASLCNWKFWLPTYCRSSSIPIHCKLSSNQGCFYLPQCWHLDTGDVTLCHQQQIMWWQSCRREHFKTARNSWKTPRVSRFLPTWGPFFGEVLYLQLHGDENRKPTSQLSWQEPTPSSKRINESNIQNTKKNFTKKFN